MEKHHPCMARFQLSPRHCFGHRGETGCWAHPVRLLTCSLTFAAPGCQQSWRLPKIIGDLHIPSKHDDCFDHIQVIMLGDKRKLSQEPLRGFSFLPSFLHPQGNTTRNSQNFKGLLMKITCLCQQPVQEAHLHGQVQGCVAVVPTGVGVGAVGEQHHGTVQAAPLHCNVQSHVSRATAGIHLGAILQQQPCHLCPSKERKHS